MEPANLKFVMYRAKQIEIATSQIDTLSIKPSHRTRY
jgi:hypothetical protein